MIPIRERHFLGHFKAVCSRKKEGETQVPGFTNTQPICIQVFGSKFGIQLYGTLPLLLNTGEGGGNKTIISVYF